MQVTFAGGVGEHGRNCFLVESGGCSFLVDCGILAGAQHPYPALVQSQVKGLRYLFLTHSHADHTGALSWLAGLGFAGMVVASSATLQQLGSLPFPAQPLESFVPPAGMTLAWGRAGHCAGSVWYAFTLAGPPERRLFFSGDYTEQSLLYAVDPVRACRADLAVLDSAYGPETRTADEMRQDFLAAVRPFVQAGQPVLFPVPQYGRGQELLLVLHGQWPELALYGDAHFCRQIAALRGDGVWTRPQARTALQDVKVLPLNSAPPPQGFCFLSGPQLRGAEALALANAFAAAGGVILTGAVEPGSGAARLAAQGLARFARIPVHCTDVERIALSDANAFRQVIPYHTAAHACTRRSISL